MKHKDVKIEIKSVDGEGEGSFTGYAAVFHNVDLGGDIIAPGAFTKTIAEKQDHPVLWAHNPSEVIGINKKYVEDHHGLFVEGQLILDVQRAKEVHALMKAGAVKGMSIGYDTKVDEYNRDTKVTTLKEVKLWEYSFTPFPMNPEAQLVGVKHLKDFEDDLERLVDFASSLKRPLSPVVIAAIERAEKQLSTLRAGVAPPEAVTHDATGPESLHSAASTLDTIQSLMRGVYGN
jgi:hypothetical protein